MTWLAGKEFAMYGNVMTGLDGSSSFQKTDTELIDSVKTKHPGRKRQALERISALYWNPVCAYLARKGYKDVEDLAQKFFLNKVLIKGALEKYDKRRAKFRTFLVAILLRYVWSVYRQDHRRPAGIDLEAVPEPADWGNAERAFMADFVAEQIKHVLAIVKADSLEARQEKHWEVFRQRFLEPILYDTEKPNPEKLCEDLGIADSKTATDMMTTVKRRFLRTLKAYVRTQVQSDDDVDPEIGEWITLLRGSRTKG